MEGDGTVEPIFTLLLIPVAVALVVVLRLFAGMLDRDRISGYITSRAGRVIGIEWAPFGRGWFGARNERIYEVTYTDANDVFHQATCKTSMLAGVYFTEDRAEDLGENARMKYDQWRHLQDENQRLRAEIERLRRTPPE